MNNRTKKKLTSVLLVLILVLGISVGYAVIQSVLTINGTATVKQSSFNVTFTDINITPGSHTKTGDTDATIVGTGNNNSIQYNITLEEPGDFYEFYAEITNAGSLDAVLKSIDISTISGEAANYTYYNVTETDGSAIVVNQTLEHGDTKWVKVRVEYRTDISANVLPDHDQPLSLTVSMNYGQA